MNLQQKGILFLSSGAFIGNIPFAPGTFGSLLGLPILFLLAKVSFWISILFVFIFAVVAVWVCERAQRLIQETDPGCVVMDEICGMVVALAGLPFTAISAGAGFALFRLLDIFKPFPIRLLEKKCSGGLGIVLDDIAAGLIANIVLRAAFFATDIQAGF